jgi:D-amino-acid dehydrogenase
MKIVILGAGIIGTATAWYLARSGHQVTVIDRQPAAALETSFANGAQISVSYCEPWASKEAPLKMLKWMTKPDSPLLYRFKLDPHQWRWGLHFLANCNDAAFARNVQQLVALGRYSQDSLHEIVSQTGIEYSRLQKGILHYFTSQSALEAGANGAALMKQFGVLRTVLTTQEVVALEPALRQFASQITGGTYTQSDESGDAKVFTQKLAQKCQEMGAQFLFDHSIEQLLHVANRVSGVRVRNQQNNHETSVNADAVVVAMGSYSTQFLRTVGESLMIYPAKGYSATLPLKKPNEASYISLIDDEKKIAISRLGGQIRIAGTAELNGFDTSLTSKTAAIRCRALVKRFEEVFPGVADVSEPHFWTGLRPSTPTNIPYIGRTQLEGLWVNAGHGTLGWTHGAGSGRALAQLMTGNQPDLDFAFYRIAPIQKARGAANAIKARASGTEPLTPNA